MESTLTKVIRTLLGLLLLFAGASKLLGLGASQVHNEVATAFMKGLVAAGYMLPLIAVTEIVCGAAFVVGRFVALGAILLAPIAVNIVLFHAVLDPSGGAPGFFVGIAEIYLLAVSFPKYQELLRSE